MRIMSTTPVNFNQKSNNKNYNKSFGYTIRTDVATSSVESQELSLLLLHIKDFKPSKTKIATPGAKMFKSKYGETLLWVDKTSTQTEEQMFYEALHNCKKLVTTFTPDMSELAHRFKVGLGIEKEAK